MNTCIDVAINVDSHSLFINRKALDMAMLSFPSQIILDIAISVQSATAVIVFVIVPCVLCLLALHTNYHAYNLHEPKCIGGAGDALHAESVHHHFPP